MNGSNKAKEYWDKNIANWGKFYLEISHSGESFDAPKWLGLLYHRTIVPIEARLMTQRFELTMNFIKQYVQVDMVTVDVGCGTGIFTVEMLKRGASVKAVDYVQGALDLTKSLVEDLVPEYTDKVEYLLMDVTQQRLPESGLVIAMGVTPYVENLSDFYANILPTTKIFYCLILDPKHWANIIRKYVPILNVRNMNCFDRSLVDSLLANHHWKLINRQDFASGYIDVAAKCE